MFVMSSDGNWWIPEEPMIAITEILEIMIANHNCKKTYNMGSVCISSFVTVLSNNWSYRFLSNVGAAVEEEISSEWIVELKRFPTEKNTLVNSLILSLDWDEKICEAKKIHSEKEHYKVFVYKWVALTQLNGRWGKRAVVFKYWVDPWERQPIDRIASTIRKDSIRRGREGKGRNGTMGNQEGIREYRSIRTVFCTRHEPFQWNHLVWLEELQESSIVSVNKHHDNGITMNIARWGKGDKYEVSSFLERRVSSHPLFICSAYCTRKTMVNYASFRLDRKYLWPMRECVKWREWE